MMADLRVVSYRTCGLILALTTLCFANKSLPFISSYSVLQNSDNSMHEQYVNNEKIYNQSYVVKFGGVGFYKGILWSLTDVSNKYGTECVGGSIPGVSLQEISVEDDEYTLKVSGQLPRVKVYFCLSFCDRWVHQGDAVAIDPSVAASFSNNLQHNTEIIDAAKCGDQHHQGDGEELIQEEASITQDGSKAREQKEDVIANLAANTNARPEQTYQVQNVESSSVKAMEGQDADKRHHLFFGDVTLDQNLHSIDDEKTISIDKRNGGDVLSELLGIGMDENLEQISSRDSIDVLKDELNNDIKDANTKMEMKKDIENAMPYIESVLNSKSGNQHTMNEPVQNIHYSIGSAIKKLDKLHRHYYALGSNEDMGKYSSNENIDLSKKATHLLNVPSNNLKYILEGEPRSNGEVLNFYNLLNAVKKDDRQADVTDLQLENTWKVFKNKAYDKDGIPRHWVDLSHDIDINYPKIGSGIIMNVEGEDVEKDIFGGNSRKKEAEIDELNKDEDDVEQFDRYTEVYSGKGIKDNEKNKRNDDLLKSLESLKVKSKKKHADSLEELRDILKETSESRESKSEAKKDDGNQMDTINGYVDFLMRERKFDVNSEKLKKNVEIHERTPLQHLTVEPAFSDNPQGLRMKRSIHSNSKYGKAEFNLKHDKDSDSIVNEIFNLLDKGNTHETKQNMEPEKNEEFDSESIVNIDQSVNDEQGFFRMLDPGDFRSSRRLLAYIDPIDLEDDDFDDDDDDDEDTNDNYNPPQDSNDETSNLDEKKSNFGVYNWNAKHDRSKRAIPGLSPIIPLQSPNVLHANSLRIEALRVEHTDRDASPKENGIPEILAGMEFQIRVFGVGFTEDTVITFTQEGNVYGGQCQFPATKIFEMEKGSFSEKTALFKITLPAPGEKPSFYICAKTAIKSNSTAEDAVASAPFVHQGNEPWLILNTYVKLLPLWATLCIIGVCLMFSALFSGLNLGLMSLDRTELKILCNTGTEKEREYARVIQPVRDHGNFLLCSILLGNVAVNSTFTILLDDLTSGLFAVIFSTVAIVMLGEITPQAICSRHGLAVGAKTIHVTKAVMAVTFPLSYPVSKLLDFLLGEEIGNVYNRERLKELVKVTTDINDLDRDEVNIISGALELRKKTVMGVMTKIEDVFMLDYEAVLDFETVSEIMKSGFSRIPVYEGTRSNIVTTLYIKDLAFVDPDDNTPLRTLCQFYQNPCNFVFEDVTLDVIFKQFKEGHKGHMAFVQRVNTEGEGDPFYETIGLVTLEDVIEELIQAEIMDETDVFTDNTSKRRRNRPAHKLQDFAVFAERRENQRIRISPQLTLATFQYLSTSVDAFKPAVVSETILRRMLKQDIMHHIKFRSKEKQRNDPSTLIYQQGKPVDYFVLILEGRVEVTVGKENLVFESGPFTYFGSQALIQNVGVEAESQSVAPSVLGSLQSLNMDSVLRYTFVPDYSVRAVTEVFYVSIKRSLYLAAKRATLMEKCRHKGIDDAGEQFDDEVEKLLHSLEEEASPVDMVRSPSHYMNSHGVSPIGHNGSIRTPSRPQTPTRRQSLQHFRSLAGRGEGDRLEQSSPRTVLAAPTPVQGAPKASPEEEEENEGSQLLEQGS